MAAGILVTQAAVGVFDAMCRILTSAAAPNNVHVTSCAYHQKRAGKATMNFSVAALFCRSRQALTDTFSPRSVSLPVAHLLFVGASGSLYRRLMPLRARRLTLQRLSLSGAGRVAVQNCVISTRWLQKPD